MFRDEVYYAVGMDVGSNSVRVFAISSKFDIYDELFYLRAGREDYFVSLEKIIGLYDGAKFKRAVATGYWREHKKEWEFLRETFEGYGWNVSLLSSVDEGRMAWEGVKFRSGVNFDCVIDIGGGSFEIVTEGEVFSWNSGAVVLKKKADELVGNSKARVRVLKKLIEEELSGFSMNVRKVVGIGGAITAVGMAVSGKGIEGLDGTIVEVEEVKIFIDVVSRMELAERERVFGKGRGDIVLEGAVILEGIMKTLGVDKITVSTAGIVHGCVATFLKENDPEFYNEVVKVFRRAKQF